MKKRMIFHIPLELDPKLKSASQIRPVKMLQGFREAGFEVDVVEGDTNKRAEQIRKIKERIKKGEKYSFMYSESSTMPTMLTSRHHIPSHPFLDFELFKICKRNGIKIGLFYRDIYWVFPEYNIGIKSKIAKFFYRIDLRLYNKFVDILFLPSLRMKEFIPTKMKMSVCALPSGSEIVETEVVDSKEKEDKIEIFYVGGIGNHYDLTMLCKCVAKVDNIHLTICCRPSDWEKVEHIYSPLMNSSIEIAHVSGSELDAFYQRADMCNLFVKPGVYWAFAMPYKLLEFIGRGKPVLASNNTATADFVRKNNVGFCIDYNEQCLFDFLKSIKNSDLAEMREHISKVANKNSWSNRALEVAELLDN